MESAQQIGLTRILERVPTHIETSEAVKCSSSSRCPSRPRKRVPGNGSSSDGGRKVWRQLFRDPSLRSDKRQDNKSSRSPDFRLKGSVEVLWLNKYKPAWVVGEQLVALDTRIDRGTPKSKSSLPEKPDPGSPPGHETGVPAVNVSTLCQQGKITEGVEALEVLAQTDCPISKPLLYTVLKKCVAKKDLVLGRRVHALSVKMGYESDTFLSNHILRMYASHARLQEAMDVFTRVATPDAFMWSSIISAHVKQGQAKQAIKLYHQMRNSSVKPDGHVFVAALQACARGADLETGQRVHADVLASGVEPDLFVVGCLVDMYAKCGRLKHAQTLFDSLPHKNVLTWTVMIAGYSQQGMGEEALHLYSAMQKEAVAPDSVTFVCLLQACASVGTMAMEKGKQLHAQIEKQRLEADVVIGCSLVNMYAKCGSLKDAQSVFDKLPEKDVVTWTAMIAGYSQQGMGQEALHLYSAMQRDGITAPDSVTFVCLLQACACVGITAIETGKQLHAQIGERRLEADVVVGNSLVNMYAKCGSLKAAQSVFDRLPKKDVVTWTAMIAGYSQQGMGQEALNLYKAMQDDGITVPNSVTCACLLQACAIVGTTALPFGKQLHAQLEDRGVEAVVGLGGNLVNMYAKCGSLEDAKRLFDRLPEKNVVTWNAMIAGYSQHGMGHEALDLYNVMLKEGMTTPDSVTFVCLLQACASVGSMAMEKGKQLHAQIGERGLEADVVVGNSLVNMYAKCGSLNAAQSMFDRLPEKNVVTWTAMIAGYSQQGMGQEALDLYTAMQEEGITAPDSVTFSCLLQACASVGTTAMAVGKELHAQIKERGLETDGIVCGSLVNMYAKCGSLEDAQSMFDRLSEKHLVTWTTMIAGYSQQGMGQEALQLYSAMQEEGINEPDSVTFVSLLQSCASVGTTAMEKGKQLHAQINKRGLEADVVLGCSLVNMYAKCGSLEDAQSVFDRLPEKNVFTWNALIAGYSKQGMSEEALHLYSAMQNEGITAPDTVTFVCLLQACAILATLPVGKELHAQIEERGLETDGIVGGSLVNMYAKCGSLKHARTVFDRLPHKNVVTWNAMIAGYSQQGMGQEALHLYTAMQNEVIVAPDSVTFVCLLQACATVAALPVGKQLHAQIVDQGLENNGVIGSSLVNMYAKCGSMIDAQRVFDSLPERVIVAWNALIAGYTRQGDSEVVFDLVRRMREECREPDATTFLSVLTVCSHAGLVKKGQEYFEAMTTKYGITPSVDHYTCMVDLLGRVGELHEALEVVRTMPVQPDDVVWHALLGACGKWRNVEVGRHAFDEAVKLNEKDAAAYVMMSNIYTGAQMWEDARDLQARRKEIGAWKQPGESWWTDPGGRVHSFSVGDQKHPESEGIYARLEQLVPKMKHEGCGCRPNLDSSLRGTSDIEKEAHLCGHSEKLAIAYGQLKEPPYV